MDSPSQLQSEPNSWCILGWTIASITVWTAGRAPRTLHTNQFGKPTMSCKHLSAIWLLLQWCIPHGLIQGLLSLCWILKNLAISPPPSPPTHTHTYDSAFLKDWVLQAETTAKLRRWAAQSKYNASGACCWTMNMHPDTAPDILDAPS